VLKKRKRKTHFFRQKNATQESEVLFLEEIKSFKISTIYFYTIHKIASNYPNLYFYLNSTSVFHPPTFIS
jgi:hypothetical protein